MNRIRPAGAIGILVLALVLTILMTPGCRPLRPLGGRSKSTEPTASRGTRKSGGLLVEVAESRTRWTGIAVSGQGRIFVCCPRWTDAIFTSVGEVDPSGELVPFPDSGWNSWKPSDPPAERFICVQGLCIDEDDNLWVLDAADPGFRGVIPGGAKIVKIDIGQGRVVRTIPLSDEAAPRGSYLADLRVDSRRGTAYATDSGLGALVVVDLKTGASRRVLVDHPSTKAEDVTITIGGRRWQPGGSVPPGNADGLALDPGGEYLYFHPLAGRTLYRIDARRLREESAGGAAAARYVEDLYETCVADGMSVGPDGYLYLTSPEDNSIKVFMSLSNLRTVVRDPRLKWPDSIAWGPDGSMYITTSETHLGNGASGPFRIFRAFPDQLRAGAGKGRR
jgi:sugar lactone lactonase YvrE